MSGQNQKSTTKGQGQSDVLFGPALKVRLQKTRMCQFYLRRSCKDGATCRFAHGQEELVQVPDLSKTSMCPNLSSGKPCNDPKCQYAHSTDEIRTTNFCHKTTQCMWYAMGKCRKGSSCRFAHGEADLNPSLNEVVERETQLKLKATESSQRMKAFMQKKEKENQKQREAQEMPEPMFIQSNMAQPMVDPVNASHAYLNPYASMSCPMMPPMMGYPMAGTGMPSELTGAYPLMQGAACNAMYNPAAMPMHMPADYVSELNRVQTLSKHIKSLTKQVQKLESTMHHNMRNDAESTFSGPNSAASGSDDRAASSASETSEHFVDLKDLDNVLLNKGLAIDNKLMGA